MQSMEQLTSFAGSTFHKRERERILYLLLFSPLSFLVMVVGRRRFINWCKPECGSAESKGKKHTGLRGIPTSLNLD